MVLGQPKISCDNCDWIPKRPSNPCFVFDFQGVWGPRFVHSGEGKVDTRWAAMISDWICLFFCLRSGEELNGMLVMARAGQCWQNILQFLLLDERQITHLICARLKYDRYDFIRGCFWAFYTRERKEAGPKHPLKKSYRSYFRRAQIR